MKILSKKLMFAVGLLLVSNNLYATDFIFYCQNNAECQDSKQQEYAKKIALAQRGNVLYGMFISKSDRFPRPYTDRVIYFNLETGKTSMYEVTGRRFSITYKVTVSGKKTVPTKYLNYFSKIDSILKSYNSINEANIYSDYVTLTGGNTNLVGIPVSVLNDYSSTPYDTILLNQGVLGIQTSNQLYSMLEQSLGGAAYLDSLSSLLSSIMSSYGVSTETTASAGSGAFELQGTVGSNVQTVTSRSGINSQRFRLLSVAGVSQLEVTIEFNYRTKDFKVVKIVDSEGNSLPVDENGVLRKDQFKDNQVLISGTNTNVWEIIASRLGLLSLQLALQNNRRGYVRITEL
ncbi:hypothetical protein [Kangiella sp.]|uniref:hypothetical protein n=1 Tax=Kangiella sp. TaxID=1920245 RepID=UPI001996C457|nr:hypothetical protein [Kangiella sp.]MBD3652793.1 hypothetical protein [Kangiella sp.]